MRKQDEKGFVMAMTVAVLAVIFSISAIIASLVSVTHVRNENIKDTMLEKLQYQQIYINFINLDKNGFEEELINFNLSSSCEVEGVWYYNIDLGVLEISNNFKNLTLLSYEDNTQLMYLKLDDDRNVILKSF